MTKIDTSEEATDEIAHAVAKEIYKNPDGHASSSMRMRVRETVLIVAEMMARVPKYEPKQPSPPVHEPLNPTTAQQGDGSQSPQT